MTNGNTEINIVSRFDWEPQMTSEKEVALLERAEQIRKILWAPGTKDFQAIAGTSVTCASLKEVLGVILSQGVGSIRRLNIFTHGESKRLSFRGHMTPMTTTVDVFFDDWKEGGSAFGMLDMEALDALGQPGIWVQVGTNPTQFTLADIRSRFVAHRPMVVLYACKSGVDETLVQAIADTLDAQVFGFRKAITFCPRFRRPRFIDRRQIGILDCSFFKTTSYDHLLTRAGIERLLRKKVPRRTARKAM